MACAALLVGGCGGGDERSSTRASAADTQWVSRTTLETCLRVYHDTATSTQPPTNPENPYQAAEAAWPRLRVVGFLGDSGPGKSVEVHYVFLRNAAAAADFAKKLGPARPPADYIRVAHNTVVISFYGEPTAAQQRALDTCFSDATGTPP